MTKKFKAGEVMFFVNKKGDEVKVVIGKETRYIKLLDLLGMVFKMTDDPEMKAQLMPVQQKEVMHFKKVHTVQVKNDMKAGETLQFTCIIDVPTYVIDGMRDIVAKEVPGAVAILNELVPQKIISNEDTNENTKIRKEDNH